MLPGDNDGITFHADVIRHMREEARESSDSDDRKKIRGFKEIDTKMSFTGGSRVLSSSPVTPRIA